MLMKEFKNSQAYNQRKFLLEMKRQVYSHTKQFKTIMEEQKDSGNTY